MRYPFTSRPKNGSATVGRSRALNRHPQPQCTVRSGSVTASRRAHAGQVTNIRSLDPITMDTPYAIGIPKLRHGTTHVISVTYGFGLSGRGFKVERIFPARMKALCTLAPTAADGPIQPPKPGESSDGAQWPVRAALSPPSTNRKPRASKTEHKPLRTNDLRRRFPDRPPSYPQAIPTGVSRTLTPPAHRSFS